MAIDSSSPRGCGIGARLRAGRERAGMTVLQAAEKLRMDSRMLEALEAERFESFGAPVFVRGHLRNYADLIGESFEELQQMFDAGTQSSAPDLTRAPRAPRVFNRGRLLRTALLVLIGAVLVCAIWWALTRRLH